MENHTVITIGQLNHIRRLPYKERVAAQEQLWQKHIQSLDSKTQDAISRQTHPSQNQSMIEEAKSAADTLSEHLSMHGFEATVTVQNYQCGMLILLVKLSENPHERLEGLPWLFLGYEVINHFEE